MAISFNPLDVLSGFNLTKLNQNFQNIKTALTDGLSRSGNGSNQMEADIDLNSNDLLNVNELDVQSIIIDGEVLIPGGEVPTGAFASKPEAEAGVNNSKIMTPQRTKEAVTSYGILRTELAPLETSTMQAQLDSFASVDAKSGVQYTVNTGLVMSNGRNIDGREASFLAGVGVDNMFKLQDFNSNLKNIYIADNRPATGPAIAVGNGRFISVHNVKVVNADAGGIVYNAGAGSVHKLDNFIVEGCGGTAVEIQSGVSKIQVSNTDLFGLLVNSTGGQKPTPGSIGWRQNTPDHTNAVGGHQIVNSDCESFDIGWWFTDAELSMVSNCHGDSCSGYALILDGTTQNMEFNGFFAGTSMGIKAGGTSQNNIIRGLSTIFTGVIPPWGSTDFYSTAGPYFDVTVTDTATLIIDGDSWRGGKRISVAPTAKLVINGGVWFQGKSLATVATNTSGWLGVSTFEGTNEANAIWRAPRDGKIIFGQAIPETAPGVGQSYTYTVRKNFSNTALVLTISGAATFSTKAYQEIDVAEGDAISIAITTSNGSAVGRHLVNVQMLGL